MSALELIDSVRPSVKRKNGATTFTVNGGERLQIRKLPDGNHEILDERVPDNETWLVNISLHVEVK